MDNPIVVNAVDGMKHMEQRLTEFNAENKPKIEMSYTEFCNLLLPLLRDGFSVDEWIEVVKHPDIEVFVYEDGSDEVKYVLPSMQFNIDIQRTDGQSLTDYAVGFRDLYNSNPMGAVTNYYHKLKDTIADTDFDKQAREKTALLNKVLADHDLPLLKLDGVENEVEAVEEQHNDMHFFEGETEV